MKTIKANAKNMAIWQLSTKEAALELGICPDRVRALIYAGRLPAKKIGRDLFIDKRDLKLVRNRKNGRPFLYKSTS